MQFIKTTFIGGLVFLVPIVIVVVIVGKAFQIMMVVAKPMSDWIPVDSVGGIAMANVLALAAIVLSCFIFGVIARSAPAKNINRGLNRILIAIPGYAFVKGYAESMDRRPGCRLSALSRPVSCWRGCCGLPSLPRK